MPMSNYQIIADEPKLLEFIQLLPDTAPDECYYVALLARNKWLRDNHDVPPIASQIQLKRFTSSRSDLVSKLRQLECAVGTYTHKGEAVPQEALGVYISVNPRSHRRAGMHVIKEIVGHLEKDTVFNVHQLALNALQSTPSRRQWFDVDVDLAGGETREDITAFLLDIVGDAATFVYTRGGLHCLVETARLPPERAKSWYNAIAKQERFQSGFDMIGDNLTPLPGCVQGGFVPFLWANPQPNNSSTQQPNNSTTPA